MVSCLHRHRALAAVFVVLLASCAEAPEPPVPVPEPPAQGDLELVDDNLVQMVTAKDADDVLRLAQPQPGQTVRFPLEVSGEARGYWFFEADFPVHLIVDGTIIATAIARAEGEWMTGEYVPFRATFETGPTLPPSSRLILRLQRDNASGLPEHDDHVDVELRL